MRTLAPDVCRPQFTHPELRVSGKTMKNGPLKAYTIGVCICSNNECMSIGRLFDYISTPMVIIYSAYNTYYFPFNIELLRLITRLCVIFVY